MRIVIQRVRRASVTVDGAITGEIGPGLLILVGVAKGDKDSDAAYLARKAAGLRIFNDEGGKMNRSVAEAGGSILAVSQFTLYADTSRGRRPGFEQAAPAEDARALYEAFVGHIRGLGLRVETGVFQAEMEVSLINSGPVTILCESSGGSTT